jgi:choline/glycine/proline betaine transport protein
VISPAEYPRFDQSINKPVFFLSSLTIFVVTLLGAVQPQLAKRFFDTIQGWLINNASWIYVLGVGTVLFFAIWLIMSRMGDIKLGPDHSEPDYSNLSWFAMLFSAGMGIGLLFFGVAEPLMHLSKPPVGDPLTMATAQEAMKITFFHWGLHAWAIYAVLAVILAYFAYRKNLPLLPRSAFYPLLGNRIYSLLGDLIDTFCVIGTLFGVATSLGLGVAQVNAGLHFLINAIPQTAGVQVVLIAIITGMATVSVVLGLDGGIKRLSNINLALAVGLLLFVLLFGETVMLLKSYVQNTGAYLSDIIYKTFNLYTYERREDWVGGWTLLYWGWWVSWAPFVGMFIARISRGRTIRQFMTGVLFVPAGFTFLWMTVFGNTAIDLVINSGAKELVTVVDTNVPVALFQFFQYFPFSSLLSILGLCLVVTFFVSSSDSGSLVIDTLASGGAAEPPLWQRIYWACLEGFVAAVLLLTGGLEALQTMTIASAFPMILLITVAMFSFLKSLREDYALLSTVQNTSLSAPPTTQVGSKNWQDRLESIVSHPKLQEAQRFLNEVVRPGLGELCDELKKRNFDVNLDYSRTDAVRLVVRNKGVENFNYGVRLRTFVTPDYVPESTDYYYRAEVFLLQGGQDYDIYGYTKEQVIADALNQYKKHLHYLHITHSEQWEIEVL